MSASGAGLRRPGMIFCLAVFLAARFSHSAPVYDQDTTQVAELNGGAGSCYYNYKHYQEGDRIITNEPCLNCTCHDRMLMCYLRVCPFTKAIGQDCTVEKRPDQCCPVITCPEVPVQLLQSSTTKAPSLGSTEVGFRDNYGCNVNNLFYADGAQLPIDPNKPCEVCYCIRNSTTCIMQQCALSIVGCQPLFQPGVCCPVRYDCDYNKTTETTLGITPELIMTTTIAADIAPECFHEGRVYEDGELIFSTKPCQHCYCFHGDIVCAIQDCGTPMETHGKNCTALPPPNGECCPTTYQCDMDVEDEATLMPDEDTSKTNLGDGTFSTEEASLSTAMPSIDTKKPYSPDESYPGSDNTIPEDLSTQTTDKTATEQSHLPTEPSLPEKDESHETEMSHIPEIDDRYQTTEKQIDGLDLELGSSTPRDEEKLVTAPSKEPTVFRETEIFTPTEEGFTKKDEELPDSSTMKEESDDTSSFTEDSRETEKAKPEYTDKYDEKEELPTESTAFDKSTPEDKDFTDESSTHKEDGSTLSEEPHMTKAPENKDMVTETESSDMTSPFNQSSKKPFDEGSGITSNEIDENISKETSEIGSTTAEISRLDEGSKPTTEYPEKSTMLMPSTESNLDLSTKEEEEEKTEKLPDLEVTTKAAKEDTTKQSVTIPIADRMPEHKAEDKDAVPEMNMSESPEDYSVTPEVSDTYLPPLTSVTDEDFIIFTEGPTKLPYSTEMPTSAETVNNRLGDETTAKPEESSAEKAITPTSFEFTDEKLSTMSASSNLITEQDLGQSTTKLPNVETTEDMLTEEHTAKPKKPFEETESTDKDGLSTSPGIYSTISVESTTKLTVDQDKPDTMEVDTSRDTPQAEITEKPEIPTTDNESMKDSKPTTIIFSETKESEMPPTDSLMIMKTTTKPKLEEVSTESYEQSTIKPEETHEPVITEKEIPIEITTEYESTSKEDKFDEMQNSTDVPEETSKLPTIGDETTVKQDMSEFSSETSQGIEPSTATYTIEDMPKETTSEKVASMPDLENNEIDKEYTPKPSMEEDETMSPMAPKKEQEPELVPVTTEMPISSEKESSHITKLPSTPSLPDIPSIPGEGNCLVDGQSYGNNSAIPPANPCQLKCRCLSSIVYCDIVQCPPAPTDKKNCKAVHASTDCCPTYNCGTTFEIPSDSQMLEQTPSTSKQPEVLKTDEPEIPKDENLMTTMTSADEMLSTSSPALNTDTDSYEGSSVKDEENSKTDDDKVSKPATSMRPEEFSTSTKEAETSGKLDLTTDEISTEKAISEDSSQKSTKPAYETSAELTESYSSSTEAPIQKPIDDKSTTSSMEEKKTEEPPMTTTEESSVSAETTDRMSTGSELPEDNMDKHSTESLPAHEPEMTTRISEEFDSSKTTQQSIADQEHTISAEDMKTDEPFTTVEGDKYSTGVETTDRMSTESEVSQEGMDNGSMSSSTENHPELSSSKVSPTSELEMTTKFSEEFESSKTTQKLNLEEESTDKFEDAKTDELLTTTEGKIAMGVETTDRMSTESELSEDFTDEPLSSTEKYDEFISTTLPTINELEITTKSTEIEKETTSHRASGEEFSTQSPESSESTEIDKETTSHRAPGEELSTPSSESSESTEIEKETTSHRAPGDELSTPSSESSESTDIQQETTENKAPGEELSTPSSESSESTEIEQDTTSHKAPGDKLSTLSPESSESTEIEKETTPNKTPGEELSTQSPESSESTDIQQEITENKAAGQEFSTQSPEPSESTEIEQGTTANEAAGQEFSTQSPEPSESTEIEQGTTANKAPGDELSTPSSESSESTDIQQETTENKAPDEELSTQSPESSESTEIEKETTSHRAPGDELSTPSSESSESTDIQQETTENKAPGEKLSTPSSESSESTEIEKETTPNRASGEEFSTLSPELDESTEIEKETIANNVPGEKFSTLSPQSDASTEMEQGTIANKAPGEESSTQSPESGDPTEIEKEITPNRVLGTFDSSQNPESTTKYSAIPDLEPTEQSTKYSQKEKATTTVYTVLEEISTESYATASPEEQTTRYETEKQTISSSEESKDESLFTSEPPIEEHLETTMSDKFITSTVGIMEITKESTTVAAHTEKETTIQPLEFTENSETFSTESKDKIDHTPEATMEPFDQSTQSVQTPKSPEESPSTMGEIPEISIKFQTTESTEQEKPVSSEIPSFPEVENVDTSSTMMTSEPSEEPITSENHTEEAVTQQADIATKAPGLVTKVNEGEEVSNSPEDETQSSISKEHPADDSSSSSYKPSQTTTESFTEESLSKAPELSEELAPEQPIVTQTSHLPEKPTVAPHDEKTDVVESLESEVTEKASTEEIPESMSKLPESEEETKLPESEEVTSDEDTSHGPFDGQFDHDYNHTTKEDEPSISVPPYPDHTIPDDNPNFPINSGTYLNPDEDYDEDDHNIYGPGTCRYGGKVYMSAQQIPRDDPCDFCFCFRGDIICLQQSCPPPIPGCHEEPISGFCCPRYECPVSMGSTLNLTTTTTTTTTTLPPHFLSHAYKGALRRTGCQLGGLFYRVGEVIKSASGPCLNCTCGGDGNMNCEPRLCSPEPMYRQMVAAVTARRRR